MAPLAVCCHGVGHDILIKLVSKIRVLRFVFPVPNILLVNCKHNLHSFRRYIFSNFRRGVRNHVYIKYLFKKYIRNNIM